MRSVRAQTATPCRLHSALVARCKSRKFAQYKPTILLTIHTRMIWPSFLRHVARQAHINNHKMKQFTEEPFDFVRVIDCFSTECVTTYLKKSQFKAMIQSSEGLGYGSVKTRDLFEFLGGSYSSEHVIHGGNFVRTQEDKFKVHAAGKIVLAVCNALIRLDNIYITDDTRVRTGVPEPFCYLDLHTLMDADASVHAQVDFGLASNLTKEKLQGNANNLVSVTNGANVTWQVELHQLAVHSDPADMMVSHGDMRRHFFDWSPTFDDSFGVMNLKRPRFLDSE